VKYLDEFNERFHVNQDVKHLTNIIYNKIYQLVPNLIRNKEVIINGLLQDKYSRILFKNDRLFIKLGHNHGVITKISVINNKIEDLEIHFTINLSKSEISQKKLINNKIKETINHEIQHVIEYYHSDGRLSKSWDFHKRLKEHESKFNNKEWLEICYLFYLAEEHELRSKLSQSLELLKNESDLKNSDLYKSIDLLSKLDVDVIFNKMDKYNDFGIILVDFVKNVLLKKGNYINIFKSYISNINKLSEKYKRKILRVLYSYENPDSFLEEFIEKEINYSEYIVDYRVEKRDELIKKILL